MIDGLLIKPLKVIRDARGQVMHMMRADDGVFKEFGEVYFSVVNPGVVKGWKKHLKMTQHFAVPRGAIRLVIFDDRPLSSTKGDVQEILSGENDYKLVRIPPLVWYGFRCESRQPAMIANCSDTPHEPQESELRPIEDERIPYVWKEIL
jgi:dTDP-4-dehydrorhamnose 3,5-epimerase